MAQRLSMNQLVAWYLYALVDFLEIRFFKMPRLKKRAGSMHIVIPIFC